jgi:starch-binding outer membrane protein, SusD/RagB family
MRTTYRILFLMLAGTLIFPSCNDDYLSETPRSFLAPENTFVNTKGFETVLTGLHIFVQQEWGWNGGNGDSYARYFAGTDIAISGTQSGLIIPFENYSIHPSNAQVQGHWDFHYRAIGNANLIIDAAENPNVKWDLPEDKNRIAAEARFFRAYNYRALVSLYGDVPLVDSPQKPFRMDFTRQPVADLLNFMIEDLKFAAQYLPNLGAKDGKIAKAAAQHLLAEIYLWAGKADLAEQAAKDVINSGLYKLMTARFGPKASAPGDVFSDLFVEHNQNRASGNLETIWAVQQEYNVRGGGGQQDGQNDWSRRDWVPNYAAVPGMILADSLGGRGLGRLRPLKWWLDSFEAQDIRASKYNIRRDYWYNNPTSANYGKKVVISQEDENVGSLYPSITKFNFGKTADDPAFLSNLKDRYKMRLAETYLLLAEAQLLQNKKPEAAASINVVRARANASPVASADVTIDYILDERARELIGETHRRFELVRTGKLLERVRLLNPKSKDVIRDHHVRWPIPQVAIDANADAVLTQNTGY